MTTEARKAMPYGIDPDPMATKRFRPPCLECPTFEQRRKKAEMQIRETYLLPPVCRNCQARMDYADATDPSRDRCKLRGREAERIEEGKVSGYRVNQGPGLYDLLDNRAAAFGWPDGVGQAVADLRDKEGCSYRVIGRLFGITPQTVSKLHKKGME